MNSAETLYQLAASAVPINDLDAPSRPGVYGLILEESCGVPSISQPGDGPLYIGTSGNLAQREFDAHFSTGKSGFSTVRRSLGALLIDQLDLRLVPRGPGDSDSNFTNYAFDDGGEKRLTEWMRSSLRVGVYAVDNPHEIEPDLIKLACPPLNLTHWANPDAPTIRTARKGCADAARAS